MAASRVFQARTFPGMFAILLSLVVVPAVYSLVEGALERRKLVRP